MTVRTDTPGYTAEIQGGNLLNGPFKTISDPQTVGTVTTFEVHPGTLAYNTDSFLRLRELAGESVGANFDPSHLLWQGMDPRVVAIVQQFRADLLAKQVVFQQLAQFLTIQTDTQGPTGFRCGIALPQTP